MVRGQECLILVAEDDDDDYLLTEQALKQEHLLNPIRRVVDGCCCHTSRQR